MSTVEVDPVAAFVVSAAVLVVGAYAVAALRTSLRDAASGLPVRAGAALVGPLREARWLVGQQVTRTERPDVATWVLAPAAYLGLGAAALAVVPLSPSFVVADVRTGIVVFGTAEALAIVAIFLHGWSPNSLFPLVAGYRFVALALSYELLSMFVLIAAAIPAESLSLVAIVDSQAGLWNVVRQPLGLPLWLVVSLGVTFTGPLDVVDGADLAGGGAAEDSGLQRLAWSVARSAMLVVFAVAGAVVFLGGWHGPLLPGVVWLSLKTLALLVLLLRMGESVARVSVERFVPLSWSVLLPLAFAHLLIAGLASL